MTKIITIVKTHTVGLICMLARLLSRIGMHYTCTLLYILALLALSAVYIAAMAWDGPYDEAIIEAGARS